MMSTTDDTNAARADGWAMRPNLTSTASASRIRSASATWRQRGESLEQLAARIRSAR